MAGTDQTESRTPSWRARQGYEETPRRETLDAEQRTQVDAIRAALALAQPARKASPRQLVHEHLAADIREAAKRGLTYLAIQKILAQNQLEINADTLRIYASKAPRKPAPLPKSNVARETRGPRSNASTTDTAPTKSAPDPPPAHDFNTESNAGGGPGRVQASTVKQVKTRMFEMKTNQVHGRGMSTNFLVLEEKGGVGKAYVPAFVADVVELRKSHGDKIEKAETRKIRKGT